MGAFLKVKSKIQSEIDGEEDLREKLEDELFEKRWLEEFEVLKKQYETKWETCTYTADEFCGLLYRSSDAQQKENLLQEYPTLMEAWKNNRVSSTSRVIPEWPAVKLVYDNAVDYNPTDCTSINPRIIECSQSLQTVLECLRVKFMWRSDDLRAFGRSLDVAGISSCSALLEALDVCSHHFERNFQSIEYPRLSKTILRVLRENTQKMMDIPRNKTVTLA
ncbi:hypothetical protein PHMEG_00027419 [Phytophthora megakarya]|uniref:Uncharacterized protein n=1 Tax=Phytophthora megakarya TaxID=4795 RepID=A0A225V5S2_9STRA|nr:hypothetical protein PHMEG_00027419 [Phytophthora megakarya]